MIAVLLAVGIVSADTLTARWASQIEEPCMNHVVAIQELVWPLTGEITSRTLEVWFVPPHRFRACYGQPDSQIVVADGTFLRTYVPDNMQVLIQHQDPGLTWRDSPLGEILNVEPATSREDTVLGGRRGLLRTWVDESGTQQFVRIEVFVAEGSAWPSRARLIDIGGNITTYALLAWERLPIPPRVDSMFVLEVPRGVETVPLD